MILRGKRKCLNSFLVLKTEGNVNDWWSTSPDDGPNQRKCQKKLQNRLERLTKDYRRTRRDIWNDWEFNIAIFKLKFRNEKGDRQICSLTAQRKHGRLEARPALSEEFGNDQNIIF